MRGLIRSGSWTYWSTCTIGLTYMSAMTALATILTEASVWLNVLTFPIVWMPGMLLAYAIRRWGGEPE